MIRFGSFLTLTSVAALALVIGTGCSGADDDKNSSSSGGSSSGGSSSGGSSSGGSSSGGSSSGGSSSGSTSSSSSSGSTTTQKKEMGAQCKDSSECKSDFCVFKGGSIGMCTQTCSDDIDCPGLGYKCVNVSDAPQKVCVPE